MLYFLEKAGKNCRSVGGSTSRWPLAAKGSILRPPSCVTSTQFMCCFWTMLRFLGIVKITIYYLTLRRRLVGPLAKFAPLDQTSSYATGYSRDAKINYFLGELFYLPSF